MKTPASVIWALTKKHNSYLVKFNGNSWSSAPTNVSGFHNASETCSEISVQADRKSTKKGFRRDFILNLAHNQHHGLKKASHSKVAHSEIRITKETGRAAKVINGLTHVNQRSKNRALRRLAKQHSANRSNVAPNKHE